MTITIIEEQSEYIINYNHMESRVNKPITLKEVKRIARERHDTVGKKVNWKIF